MYFGEGPLDATPIAYTINGCGGTGTNIAAGDLQFAGGRATGNAVGGSIVFQTSDAGGSGTTLQSLTTKMTLTAAGDLLVSNGGGLVVGHTALVALNFGVIPELQVLGTGSADSVVVAGRFSADSSGPALYFTKGRDGIGTTTTDLISGDQLGIITWSGVDITDNDFANEAARISVEVDGTPGNNDMPGRMVFLTTADSAASTTEAFRINASQQVIAGTAAGWAVLNETSSATNPTLIPDRTELGTGIGGTSNNLSLIHTGTETLTVNSTGVSIIGDVYSTAWTTFGSSSTIIGWEDPLATSTLINYKKVGNLVFIQFYLDGVSDTTAVTFTLPFTQVNTNGVELKVAIQVGDNGGATVVGLLVLAANSATANCFLDMAGTAWTASGNKRVQGQFWFEAQ